MLEYDQDCVMADLCQDLIATEHQLQEAVGGDVAFRGDFKGVLMVHGHEFDSGTGDFGDRRTEIKDLRSCSKVPGR